MPCSFVLCPATRLWTSADPVVITKGTKSCRPTSNATKTALGQKQRKLIRYDKEANGGSRPKNGIRKALVVYDPRIGQEHCNSTLREQFRRRLGADGQDFTDQDYWQLRDSLIDDGHIVQGRGRGGSVHRVIVAAEEAPATSPQLPIASNERSLYEPFQTAILSGYVKDNRIKRFISEITASQGRRSTGGKWTRPDLTLIAVRTYSFTPGKRPEVITFGCGYFGTTLQAAGYRRR